MPPPKDPEKRALWTERQRLSHLGKKQTPESNAKRAEWNRRTKTGVARPDMRGDQNPMRRSDVVAQFCGDGNPRYTDVPTYGGIHDRLDAQRGKATTHDCIKCGGAAQQWALLHAARADLQNPRGCPYSLNLDDYVPMCISCHVRYDKHR